MKTFNIDSAEFAALLKLSGMAYSGYTRTADDWKEVTGVDPRSVRRDWVHVTSSGLCALTKAARDLLDTYFATLRRNWAALGISNGGEP